MLWSWQGLSGLCWVRRNGRGPHLEASADGDTREVPVGTEQSSTVLTGLRPGVEYTVHVWAQKGVQRT